MPPRRVNPLARPRVPSRVPALPRGPDLYAPRPLRIIGPGNPPPGFVGASTSASEWYVYWALWKIFNEQGDVRKGPFYGSPTGRWRYQASIGSNQTRTGITAMDFFIEGRPPIGIRVQSERYHVFVDSKLKAYDRMQNVALGRRVEVIDLYEQDFIEDRSGGAIIIRLKSILAGNFSSDPSLSGTAQRAKRT